MDGETGERSTDHDVVVVGGGPAGSAAAVFLARYGLDTVVFDRGRSSLKRCAHLSNYPGFPAGIDIETFYDLLHDHVETAGATLIPDLVETVGRADAADGFRVEPQEGAPVAARSVVAATRYGGDYLRQFDDGEMFESADHSEADGERFARDYADADGRTPIEGLYVASPSPAADRQAIVAAGRGARVGLTVLRDWREARGIPSEVADHYDWLRRDAELGDEWRDRDRWREWLDDIVDQSDIAEDRWRELREAEIDRRRDTYLTPEEIEAMGREGQRRLLDHVDDDLIRERARALDASSGD